MANVQLTKDAIEKLNQEAEYLKGSKRAELQEGIEVAKKLSDAEQKEAHDEYAKNESRIAVLEELIDGTFQREAANQTRTAQPVRVTLEGLINLMAELDFLRTTKRQEIKEAIKIAKGFGDHFGKQRIRRGQRRTGQDRVPDRRAGRNAQECGSD